MTATKQSVPILDQIVWAHLRGIRRRIKTPLSISAGEVFKRLRKRLRKADWRRWDVVAVLGSMLRYQRLQSSE